MWTERSFAEAAPSDTLGMIDRHVEKGNASWPAHSVSGILSG